MKKKKQQQQQKRCEEDERKIIIKEVEKNVQWVFSLFLSLSHSISLSSECHSSCAVRRHWPAESGSKIYGFLSSNGPNVCYALSACHLSIIVNHKSSSRLNGIPTFYILSSRVVCLFFFLSTSFGNSLLVWLVVVRIHLYASGQFGFRSIQKNMARLLHHSTSHKNLWQESKRQKKTVPSQQFIKCLS